MHCPSLSRSPVSGSAASLRIARHDGVWRVIEDVEMEADL